MGENEIHDLETLFADVEDPRVERTKRHRLQDIIILALTAYAMKGDEERIRAAGCDGYIPKPIDTRLLPVTVATYLDANRSRA